MRYLAIQQNGEQPNPTGSPFIHSICWHRFPFSSKHPNSAGAISSAQRRKSISPSIAHQPATVKYRLAKRRIHSPTAESWPTTAISVGAHGASLHVQPLRRFRQHKIAENDARHGVVPAVPPRRPWGRAAGSHRPRQGSGGRQKSRHLMTKGHRALGSTCVGSVAYRSLLVNLSFS